MTETTPSTGYSPEAGRVFTVIREALPSFAIIDEARRDEWDAEGSALGYIRAAALADHVVGLAADARWTDVQAVLAVAELTLTSGDAYAATLVTEGLLEDIQNAALRSDGAVRLVDIRERLGPSSLLAWDALMELWHGPASHARKSLPDGSVQDA